MLLFLPLLFLGNKSKLLVSQNCKTPNIKEAIFLQSYVGFLAYFLSTYLQRWFYWVGDAWNRLSWRNMSSNFQILKALNVNFFIYFKIK